jgi:predicted Holliday junction resolvase-like endonuclease
LLGLERAALVMLGVVVVMVMMMVVATVVATVASLQGWLELEEAELEEAKLKTC